MFKLLGRATIFKTTRTFTNKAGISCVNGVTLDGKYQIVARVVDVKIVG